jgi:hypothetical protein
LKLSGFLKALGIMLIIFCLLPFAFCFLLFAFCFLLFAFCLLPSAHCQLTAVLLDCFFKIGVAI